MLCYLMIPLVLGQLLCPAMGQVNCSELSGSGNNCGKFSANGCCAKGCVRNARGRCVVEDCVGSWNGWLRRPVTMSCYFHWFLLIFAAFIVVLMLTLVTCNLVYELCNCVRKRQQATTRYLHLSPSSSMSSSVV
ncbi:hypothetical protein KR044_010241 [Drosophila immigrans]|nr:hypothetical protein KR044_010241 [Drosophila immigrans]